MQKRTQRKHTKNPVNVTCYQQVKEIENYTVRPKSNKDVEVSIDDVIEAQHDAVSPNCDMDAESSDDISKKDAEIRKPIEERRNTSNEEKLRLKNLSKHTRKCIRV